MVIGSDSEYIDVDGHETLSRRGQKRMHSQVTRSGTVRFVPCFFLWNMLCVVDNFGFLFACGVEVFCNILIFCCIVTQTLDMCH